MRVALKVKMDWKRSSAPLEKMPQETSKANQALVDYAALGSGRSFAKLIERYQKVPKTCPTTRLNTLKGWSVKYEWQARVARQEELMQQEQVAQWDERVKELREREWKLSMSLMDKAEQMLKFPLAEKTVHEETSEDGKTIVKQIFNPSKWYFVDAAKVLRVASRVARLATNQDTERLRHVDWLSEIVELLRSGQVSPAEVREELGDELARKAFVSAGLPEDAGRETADEG